MVSAIAINPYNPNVIYIGTAGGGVWRMRDGARRGLRFSTGNWR